MSSRWVGPIRVQQQGSRVLNLAKAEGYLAPHIKPDCAGESWRMLARNAACAVHGKRLSDHRFETVSIQNTEEARSKFLAYGATP